MKRIKYFLIIIFAFAFFYKADAKILEYRAAVSLYDLYQVGGTSSPFEAKFSKPSSGEGRVNIDVYTDIVVKENLDVFPVILYRLIAVYNSATNSYKMNTTKYPNPVESFGPMASYYPIPWESDDIKASSFAVKKYYIDHIWTKLNPNELFYDLLGSTIPIKIAINTTSDDIVIHECKLPGIGEVYTQDTVSETLRFDQQHPCRDINSTNPICAEWVDLKTLQPDLRKVDIKYAAHRGFWGDSLGAGPVENTDRAIVAALKYTKIIESDIMITKDSVVVVSHDYNLQRLTNYNGSNPDNTFIYDLNFDQIKDLLLRRRNFEVTDFRFIQLKDLINYMKQYKTVLTIDIKEKAPRRNPITGDCTAACEMTNEDRMKAWVGLFQRILEVVDEENAWEYVAVKTPHTINAIKKYLPQSHYRNMYRILYFPVIQPQKSADEAIDFICDWYNNAPNLLMGFETNFKSNTSNALQSCVVEDTRYYNLLHFVARRMGVRPGMYPEEPMGPKGIVDRYAQWLFKDLTGDFRGDPYWLMSIPYFETAILTTDRPDIWQEVKKLYE